MKLTFNAAAPQGEEWQRKNRKPHIYPPPNDGREWILVDEAAALFGIKTHSMMQKAGRIGFTRTCRRGIKMWLLKKEITDYLAFLKDRERWYKRRRPKHWEPEVGSFEGETDEQLQRIFWTTAQAAAFMDVAPGTVRRWVKQGKIPVFVNRKTGEGGRYWFSQTSLRNLKEDEERLKWLARHQKAKETLRAGIVEREVYKTKNKPRVYKNLPPGWLTVREVADILQISRGCVHVLRKRGDINAEQLTGAWDQKIRPWFIHKDSVEKLKNDPDYQKRRRNGQKAVEAMIGKSIYSDPDANAEPPQRRIEERADLPFGYTREERRIIKAADMW